jgi:hypothetical protein
MKAARRLQKRRGRPPLPLPFHSRTTTRLLTFCCRYKESFLLDPRANVDQLLLLRDLPLNRSPPTRARAHAAQA